MAPPSARRHVQTYRSGLEEQIGQDLLKRGVHALYEAAPLRYTRPVTEHRYTADWFVRRDGGEVTYDFVGDPLWCSLPEFWAEHLLIESKGIFSPEDRKKHILIQQQYPMADIRFVFTRSKSPLRKGSKTTYGGWCEKHGFLYADGRIPDDWFTQ